MQIFANCFNYWKTWGMFRITWVRESTFVTANFIKSRYRPIISDENLTSKLSCGISVSDMPDFEDFL